MNLDGAKEWDFEVLKCVFKMNFWEFWVGSEYDDFNLSEFLKFGNNMVWNSVFVIFLLTLHLEFWISKITKQFTNSWLNLDSRSLKTMSKQE